MAAPANLPAQLTSFVGRERELAALAALLAEVRLVTLTGPGGCGKTRLALEAAARQSPALPGGVAFVALAAIRDPALVVPAIAQALRVPETGGRALLESLTQELGARTLLLILDNFEQVAPAAPAVAALLAACPHLRVLATSRAPLHLYGEQEFVVPPLAVPAPDDPAGPEAWLACESVRLFLDRARLVRHDFTLTPAGAAAVAEICRRLDGLPLALELAAARSKLFAPQALLARLVAATDGGGLGWLAGAEPDRPARQRTLDGAIAWSYDLLTAAEQAAFRRLAVFAGGFVLEAARPVAGPAAPDEGGTSDALLDLLASLVDKSLLQRGEGPDGEPRFAMLETIREYGRARLEAAGEADAARDRHAAYFLALAEAAEPELRGPRQVHWLDRLEREHDNLRAALTWLLDRGAATRALRLAELLGGFWSLRGYFGEGRAWLERALALAEVAAPLDAAAGAALNWAGLLAYRQSDARRARAALERAAAIFRAAANPEGLAYSLTMLGLIVLDAGDSAGGWALLEESVGLFRAVGVTWGLALALRNLAEAARAQGHPAARRALLQESVTLFREVGDHWGLAVALGNLGRGARQEGDCAAAGRLFAESLALFSQLGDRQGIAWGLAEVAGLAVAQGRPAQAARLFGAAEALVRAIGARLDLIDRTAYDQDLALAQGHLAGPAFGAALAEGRALSLEVAVALAVAACGPAPADVPAGPVAPPVPAAPARPGACLTRRELDVLRLVAAGQTDAEVAAGLSLSRRTVHAHLRSIFDKLGVSTRTAATRSALERGLL